MSQFGFLKPEWPDLFAEAARAESLVRADPRAATFYMRRTLERTLAWLYKADQRLKLPYQDNLAALIHEPTFPAVVGQPIFFKARYLKDLGNRAVHKEQDFPEADARAGIRELFHLAYWLVRSYARGAKPDDGLAFDASKLPIPMVHIARISVAQLRKREAELQAKDEKLAEILAGNALVDAELQALRAEVAAARAANTARPDRHDYGEAATRDQFIDLMLREAGWDPAAPGVAEFEVAGMPNPTGRGFVDYVLWGDDGKPLGLLEAKATRHDAHKGQVQARLYADCLEQMFQQRPIIFCSNGYEHVIWDDTHLPPRRVQGFHTKEDLALMIQRRTTRKSLADATIDNTIVERPYQFRAIRHIGESFEVHKSRKALVVMATGAGKTRLVIALSDLLMRCNWAKRILFLADRVALVNQAVGAFKKFLPGAPPVNLLTDKATDGRMFVSTYPTMMSLIGEEKSGQRRFGVGHFDLVVVDEAHRSIYKKYGAIFDYFDSYLVGLTATPKDEIDRNTYRLFDLENGVPTDAYPLEQAVADGFLVPMRGVSVPLKFVREGITYDQLPQHEKDAWEETSWGEDGEIPDRVEAAEVNKFLFNADTIDKMLAHLMTHGQQVAGGDRLGKTIIFAKNSAHAAFIQQRFDANYPRDAGVFAQVIDYKVDYAAGLIDSFSNPTKAPHIAISVDMLDTGIDVPEVVNLVFFKLVRSKTKFWQMIGRGTRLCPALFGPDRDKTHFTVFDFCQNLEFFGHDTPTVEGAVGESLGARLFRTRLDLTVTLDRRTDDSTGRDGAVETALRQGLAETLRTEVAAMNVDNFIVRPKRRLVERFAKPDAWQNLDEAAQDELSRKIAGLPSEREPEREEAKRFDLLLLTLQLQVLVPAQGFERLKQRVIDIAAALEGQSAIPVIRDQLELIQEVQSDEWWQDVTLAMLESARKRLRSLVHLIETSRRKPIFTDFEDEIGDGVEIEFERFLPADAFEKFRLKARHFLRAHENHVAINKLRMNLTLTSTDLEELERMLAESGVGTPDDVARAKLDSQGLGLFVRSLVGLDREAAKEAFAGFLSGKTLRANQIEFIDMMIEHLTEGGVMEVARLYESPFTNISDGGPEAVFGEKGTDELNRVLDEIRLRAAA
jgi:type I restriction enzyme, R subunit